MAYIEENDYNVLIPADELEIVQQATDANRLNAEAMAEDEMKSYLATRYDVDAIFSQTGADRNKAVLMFLMDMVLYHLHSTTEGFDKEKRETRYANAIEWLDKVANGKIAPDLPYITDDDGADDANNPVRWNSDLRNENSW